MRVIINDTECVFPSSLAEFTLGQRIDYHNQCGNELDAMAESILKMEDGLEKDLELMQFQFEKMIRTVAFFMNTTPDALKESTYLDDIANIYHANMATLFDEEQDLTIESLFVFKGEQWELHPPHLKHGSKMTFGEFIDAKQMVQNLNHLGASKWEHMLRLCAIYLRKKGEPYREEFLYEGSERIELMKELPLTIALSVGFFLTSSLNICLNTLPSSSPRGRRLKGSDLVHSILSAGAG